MLDDVEMPISQVDGQRTFRSDSTKARTGPISKWMMGSSHLTMRQRGLDSGLLSAPSSPEGRPSLMKTIAKIAIGIVLGCVLLIGGCVAVVGGVASEVDREMKKEAKESTTGKQAGSDAGNGGTAKNVVGNWTIENMGQVKFAEEYGSFKTIPLKVRNNSDEADSPWFEIRLTDAKGDLVATFDCIGDEFEPDQGGNVDCSTLDDFAKFKDWELKDAF